MTTLVKMGDLEIPAADNGTVAIEVIPDGRGVREVISSKATTSSGREVRHYVPIKYTVDPCLSGPQSPN